MASQKNSVDRPEDGTETHLREVVERFEDAWLQGERPDLAEFLPPDPVRRQNVLIELVHIDLEYRLKAGEPVLVERYVGAHAELAGIPGAVPDLLAAEFRLRRRREPGLTLQEYLARFPQHHDDLLARLNGPANGDTGEIPRTGAAQTPVDRKSSRESRPGSQGWSAGSTLPILASADYEILGELGRGGMGIVYRAHDHRRDLVVALKTLPRLDPAALYQFKQEFRAVAEVAHPNLVTLYELIADGPQWFFTMELIDGVDFLTSMGSGRGASAKGCSDPARLRMALKDLVEAVLALHAAGKLHRDIKPSNVLVTAAGRVVLLDFGLAAELDALGLHHSSEGGVVGTVAYMAPEQAAGLPVSPAIDWYSVGVMLYEALTGHLPFQGDARQILRDKQDRDPPAPGELAPGIPEDLQKLCVELLCRDPAQRLSGRGILERLASSATPSGEARTFPTSQTRSTVFVGRERHLRALHEALRDVQLGKTVTVCLAGISGTGKSALVQHFLDEVDAPGKAVTLAGRCYEHESVPFKAVDNLVDALSGYLRRLPASEVETLLPSDILPLTRVFPVLRRVEAVARAPARTLSTTDPHELRRRAFGAFRELLTRLGARQPLVLWIDDLQWGDVDSAALLAELLRPPDAPMFLLLGCYRSDEAAASPFLRAFLHPPEALATAFEQRELPVEALSDAEAQDLALTLLGHVDLSTTLLAGAIAREAGGNPFYIYELVEHVQMAPAFLEGFSPGQITLDQVLWERAQRLPEEARRLLEVVAVAGRPLRQRDVYQAAGVDAAAPALLAVLRSGRFIRRRGPADREDLECYHDRIRETVAAHVAPDTRVDYHRRLAETLEAAGEPDPEVLAVHFQASRQASRAAHHYTVAADQATEALAFDHAARLYRLALELGARDGAEERRLRTRLADALANAGRGAEAAREYMAATEGAAAAQSLELQRRAASQLLTSGHVDEGVALLRPVLSAAGTRLAASPLRALLSLLLRRAWLRVRGLGFRERRAEEVAPELLERIDICWSVVVGLSTIDPIRGSDFQTRNLLLALRAGEPFRIARALAVEAGFLGSSGPAGQRRATRILEDAEPLARRVGQPYALGIVEMAQGTVAYFAQRWKTSLELSRRAEQTFRTHCTGVAWEIDTASVFSLWSLTRMGAIAELNRICPLLLKEAHERGDRYAVTNLSTQIMTLLYLAEDDPQGARQKLERVMGEWSQKGYHIQHHDALLAFVPLELYAGNADAAWQRVVTEWSAFRWSLLSQVHDLWIEMVQLRAYCALAMSVASADPAPFLRAAARDARALRRQKMPWTEALAVYIQAALAAARGDPGTASKLLTQAVTLFDAVDAQLHAAATRQRLSRLVGGEAGAALRREADDWMQCQGIRNLDRMTVAYAPGFAGNVDELTHPGGSPGRDQIDEGIYQ